MSLIHYKVIYYVFLILNILQVIHGIAFYLYSLLRGTTGPLILSI